MPNITVPVTQEDVVRERLREVLRYFDSVAAERALIYQQIGACAEDQKISLPALNAVLNEAGRAQYNKAGVLANVNHQSQTPLAIMQGISNLKAHHSLVLSPQHVLPTIITSSEYLFELVNDLITYASLRGEKVSVNCKEVNLVVLFEEFLPPFKATAETKGLQFEIQLEKLPPAWKKPHLDVEKLKRVLRNVLDNALKFTDKGTVSVALQRGKCDGFPLTIVVKDSGTGIPADRLAQINAMFAQGNQRSAGHYAGIGIGLSLAHSLLGLMEGALEISSEPGYGTTVVIHLPLDGIGVKTEPEVNRGIVELDQMASNLRNVILQRDDTISALHKAQVDGLLRLASAAELKDGDTGTHIMRMGHYSALIASACGQNTAYCDTMLCASRMHDVGKIGIPDSILKKPTTLTADEWEVMRRHPEIGAALLASEGSPLHDLAAEIALSHHEKWDGSGYPYNLKGNCIPLSGRIVAVADYFDALTMDRCYRPAVSDSEALAMLDEQKGKHFDPMVVDAFFMVKDSIMKKRDEINRSELVSVVVAA